MAARDSLPLPRERYLILALLLLLGAGAWAALLWSPLPMGSGSMGLTMGVGAPLFIAIWVVMMVAMMFPTAAPMVLTFNRISAGKQQNGQAFVPTWVFVGTYLLVWTFFGMLAYAVALAAGWLAGQTPALADNAARIGGAILALGGLYQLSPLKHVCLSKCRTPLSFILSSWRDGYWGACRLGLSHGVYCLGCCWLLFVILFPLGVMNVAAMAVLTVLIYTEKSLPIGPRVARLAAIALIAYGVLVILMPGLLPGVSEPMPAPMPMK